MRWTYGTAFRNLQSGRFRLAWLNAHACGSGPHTRAGGEKPDILGVRLGVKQTGCAGFGYVLDTVTEPEKDDLVFETDGAKLYVALQAMPFIDGTEVDYVREGLNQLFKFHNPKAQNECGCGESFGV